MKDFNLVQYLRENNQGSFGMLNHYVDLKPLKEENQEVPYQGPEDKLDGFGDSFDQVEAIPEMDGVDGNNSFDVNLVYTDYPSMSDAQQRLSTIQFLKLVKSLGGVATKTNDDFDTITFSVTGIPSLEVLEDKYSQVVNNEDDNYVALGSWDLQPVDSETTSLSEMYTDMKEEGEGFQSQHADSADWERFYQEGWNAGYDEGYRDAKKEFNTTGNNDYYKFFR